MDEKLEEYMKEDGWEVECYSPLEIRNEDGSFASLQAANIVTSFYRGMLDEELADKEFEEELEGGG